MPFKTISDPTPIGETSIDSQVEIPVHHHGRIILLISFSVVLLFLGPQVFLGKSIYSGFWADSAPCELITQPLWIVIKNQMTRGIFPFWNSLSGLGSPIYSDIAAGIWVPTNWISLVLAPHQAWPVIFTLRFLVTTIGSFRLFAYVTKNLPVSVGFALIYLFNGHFGLQGNLWHMNTVMLIPYFLQELLEVFREKPKRKHRLTIPVLTFFMIAGGGYIDLIVLGFFLVVLGVFVSYRTDYIKGKEVIILSLMLLSLVVAAPVILPLIELRSHALPVRGPRSGSGYQDWLYIFDIFFGKLHKYKSVEPSYDAYFNFGISFVSIFGSVLAFFNLKSLNRFQRVLIFSSGLFVFLYFYKLLWMPGSAIVNLIPVLNLIYFPKYLSVPYLLLCLMGAIGIQVAIESKGIREAKQLSIVFLFFPTIMVLRDYRPLLWKPVPILMMYFLTIGLLYFYLRAAKPHSKVIVIICCLAAFLEFPSSNKFFRKTEPIFKVTREMSIIRSDAHDSLVQWRTYDVTGHFIGKEYGAFSMGDPSDYTDSMDVKYWEFFSKYVFQNNTANFTVLHSTNAGRISFELLGGLGTKYFIFNSQDRVNLGLFENVKENVWKLRTANPRAYIAENILVAKSESEEINLTVQTLPKTRALAVIPSIVSRYNGSSGTATIVHDNMNSIEIAAEASSDALLVLNDLNDSNWKVTVNGRPSEIIRTNYLARSVAVPPGKSNVSFKYVPKIFYLAWIIAGIGMILLGFWFRFDAYAFGSKRLPVVR